MKTLVVTYLPRGERSHTRKLLQAFIDGADGADIEYLDLLADTPPLLDAQRTMAYVRRNFLGEALAGEDEASLAELDRLTEQFMRADAVVMAFPMRPALPVVADLFVGAAENR